jgi:hypothetical protein
MQSNLNGVLARLKREGRRPLIGTARSPESTSRTRDRAVMSTQVYNRRPMGIKEKLENNIVMVVLSTAVAAFRCWFRCHTPPLLRRVKLQWKPEYGLANSCKGQRLGGQVCGLGPAGNLAYPQSRQRVVGSIRWRFARL